MDRVSGVNKYPDHPVVPGCIVQPGKMIDIIFKQPGQVRIFRRKMALAHNPAGPVSSGIKDQDSPAAVIAADLRTRQVNGAVTLRRRSVEPEERARLRAFQKDTPVAKEIDLVRVDNYFSLFPGILVVDEKPVIPVILPDSMDQPEMAAAFPALAAFKRHS